MAARDPKANAGQSLLDRARLTPTPRAPSLASTALAVAPSWSAAEREADRTAQLVTRSGAPTAGPGFGDRAPPAPGGSAVLVQRRAVETYAGGGGPSPPILGRPGGAPDLLADGRPLHPRERAFFEPRFGADFSTVRIHEGPRASAAAEALSARAFTVGEHVAFRRGELGEHERGQLLMAHELTHVLQQRASPVGTPTVQRAEIDDAPEHCEGLDDISGVIDAHVNGVLRAHEGVANPQDRVKAVYQALGTGSPYSKMEDWILTLSPRQQRRISVRDSRYDNAMGGSRSGSNLILNSWWKGDETLGVVINVAGRCIGSDKLGHFFQQGHEYYQIADVQGFGEQRARTYGEWLEGIGPTDPALKAWIERQSDAGWPGVDPLMFGYTVEQGVFGLATTGVYSRGDLSANAAGMGFYRAYAADPKLVFDVRSIVTGDWNERENPSCFGPDMADLLARNDPELIAEYRALVSEAVKKNPYMSAYAGVAILDSLKERYITRYQCP